MLRRGLGLRQQRGSNRRPSVTISLSVNRDNNLSSTEPYVSGMTLLPLPKPPIDHSNSITQTSSVCFADYVVLVGAPLQSNHTNTNHTLSLDNASILFRYPATDRTDVALPPSTAMVHYYELIQAKV